MTVRPGWTVAHLAALAALAVGCPESRPKPGTGETRAERTAPGLRGGVKVPLPDGWTAQVGPDDALLVGPPGHPVLRIEPRPGAGERLPTAEALAAAAGRELQDSTLSVLSQQNETNLSMLIYRLSSSSRAEAGPVAETRAMLGAKRVGRQLFLCSTVPGTIGGEADLAAKACAGLSVAGGD